MPRTKFFVSVDVILIKDGALLLGRRKGAYGAGMWGLPGGHLEDHEGVETAALRELNEETGLVAKSATFVAVFNNKDRPDAEHYLHVAMYAEGVTGDLVIKEPERCEEWRWFNLTDLPRSEILWVHLPLIDAYLNKKQLIDHI